MAKAIGDYAKGTERFFAYARERHAIYLRRAAGQPKPWSKDPIFHGYKFTNVFRELDRTTIWFREHVRDKLRDKPEVLLATVLFRMLNRIEVGEAIFSQRDLITGESAWDEYLGSGKMGPIRGAIRQYCGKGPYVTGAYIISTPPGKPKLDGALWIVDQFARRHEPVTDRSDPQSWKEVAHVMKRNDVDLKQAFEWLRRFPYLGTFHSYEIVTDLRHTALLERASDINTWANIGPGCRRGMNRIRGRRKPDVDGRKGWGVKVPTDQVIGEMQELLVMSRDDRYWPQKLSGVLGVRSPGYSAPGIWPKWEMRDVEHTLCEFDKYERVRTGEGRPRGRFY